MDRLLAKKPRDAGKLSERETLPGHASDVLAVGETIWSLSGNALSAILADEVDATLLRKLWVAACVLHDLGKANDAFQAMVRGKRRWPQPFRHEWLSAWLTIESSWDGMPSWWRDVLALALIGHHLRFDCFKTIRDRVREAPERTIVFFGDHADVERVVRLTKERGVDISVPCKRIEVDLERMASKGIRDWFLECQDRWDCGEIPRRTVSLLRGLLMAADVAGSALPREGMDPAAWTAEVLGRRLGQEDLFALVSARLGGNPPREFQRAVAQTSGRVCFVKAGCGSGKTVAAYLWAAERAVGKKLFFCYPTTGTTTEGFKDYVMPTELAEEARLVHSRAEVDLEDLYGTPDGESGADDEMLRLKALQTWDAPLVVCTAHTVLALMQMGRLSLCSLPSFLDAAFVFDEIHLYDDRMFSALLGFLRAFRMTPVLLMTASLQRPRLEALRAVLGDFPVVEGPRDLETAKRYRLEGTVRSDPPWGEVEACLRNGGKVLWVSNTVDRCVERYREALGRWPDISGRVSVYHSRFRYCDRNERHEEVIKAFRGPGPFLAFTTQVCEVSLDISADLLVTDLAPVPSLIQRLGRLNRRLEHPTAPALVLRPEHASPYTAEDLSMAERWLTRCGGEVSQADLAVAFTGLEDDRGVDIALLHWEEPVTHQASLTEPDPSVDILRPEDVAAVTEKGRVSYERLTRYVFSMFPTREVVRELSGWERCGYAYVPPPGRLVYDTMTGGRWA